MTRREALHGLAALAAIGTLPSVHDRTSRSADRLDHLGLALITVRSLVGKDFERLLADIAAIGYRDLDMYVYEWPRPARETRAALDRAGLKCRSARVATPALYRGWDRTLDAATTLGARWITLANVPWEERRELVDWREMAAQFNRLGEASRARGLGFCYHNHDFELQAVDGVVPLDYIVSSTDPALVKLQMDVYWMTKGGRDPSSEIDRLGSRVATLHLKDMDRTPQGEITSPGNGVLDFRKILAAAKRAGIADLFVEVDPSPADPVAVSRSAYNYLMGLDF
jgi:sugar phosphate isomerase/epimerase